MKTAIDNLIRLALAFSLAFAPQVALAKQGPADDLTAEVATLDAIAKKKTKDFKDRPEWFKRLQVTKLITYFKSAQKGEEPKAEEVEMVLNDVKVLGQYLESEDPKQELAQVTEKKIKPFLKSLTLRKLLSRERFGKITEPIANWTLESLFVRKSLQYIAETTSKSERVQKIMSLVTGPHFKGASRAATALVMGASFFYMFRDYGGSDALWFVTGLVMGAFRAGPMATLMNAATSWFINPAVEYIKVVTLRRTGPIEAWLNRQVDRVRPKGTGSEEESNDNVSPKMAVFNEDGTNYGGMSVKDQETNWTSLLEVWIGQSKHLRKLLRDTHHDGRNIVNGSWSDEMVAAQFVETMDTKLSTLTIEEMQILGPYQTALMAGGQFEKKDQLDALFDEYRRLCERTYSEKLSDAELRALGEEIVATQAKFKNFGISEAVAANLYELQVKRAAAVQSLATGLAIHQLRAFATAEWNRNLVPKAREAQRAVHRGFSLERMTANFGLNVAEKQREMGFENSGETLGQISCETLLERAVGEP